MLIIVVAVGLYIGRSLGSVQGKRRIDGWKISLPVIGNLYKKVYLSRIADNMDTMLSSSIPVLRALEITGEVVDNQLYKDVMQQAVNDVKAGVSISSSFEKHDIIPPIMVQMVRVGEETGSLGAIFENACAILQT